MDKKLSNKDLITNNITSENKILNFNKYSFLLDNFDFLNEGSLEFNQYQWSQDAHGLGPGYGFASDPQISIYSDDTSPYRDNYARTGQIVNDISRIIRNIQGDIVASLKNNFFIDDIDDYNNFKILRLFVNNNFKIDIYFSFDFKGDEFFAVFNNFNGLDNPPKMKSDLFNDNRYRYINKEYYLKLNNYLYKIIYNWFIPDAGKYINLKENTPLKANMGEIFELKNGKVIDVIGYNVDENNDPYLIIEYNNETYTLVKNNYYYFKYWFEKIK